MNVCVNFADNNDIMAIQLVSIKRAAVAAVAVVFFNFRLANKCLMAVCPAKPIDIGICGSAYYHVVFAEYNLYVCV